MSVGMAWIGDKSSLDRGILTVPLYGVVLTGQVHAFVAETIMRELFALLWVEADWRLIMWPGRLIAGIFIDIEQSIV